MTQDAILVKYMAQCPSAMQVKSEGAFVAYINLPPRLRNWISDDPYSSTTFATLENDFSSSVRDHIANNRAVVVRGWYPQIRTTFSIEDICAVRPTMPQRVQVVDTMVRERNVGKQPEDQEEEDTDTYKPLSDFILDAHDLNTCGGVLELPNLRPEAPFWLK